MANYKSGAQRHNDMMDRIFDKARKLEKERLEKGEEPNPSLTSPEVAKKYGWEIKGREVKKIMAKKMRIKHSDEKHLLYRTFKDKDDYNKAHFKSTTIHPSRSTKKFDKKHADYLLRYETN